MSKYVRGVKRNQIIQRWLQGIEDPEYEVFPTKKEGKYIVRLRESKLNDTVRDKVAELSKSNESVDDVFVEDKTEEKSDDNLPEDTEPESKPTRSRRPQTSSSTIRSSDSTIRDSEVHGINLEILEQLRNLGEEIRNDRFKKEQKQFIKQIVNKELNKSRIRSKYVPDVFPENESAKQEAPPEPIYQEPQPEPTKFRSRIRR